MTTEVSIVKCTDYDQKAVMRSVRRAVDLVGGINAFVNPGIGDLRRVCERSGILAVIEQEGALLADLDEAAIVKNTGRFQRFEIARATIEADVILNLPKFKTHGMTVLTGAVKNCSDVFRGNERSNGT